MFKTRIYSVQIKYQTKHNALLFSFDSDSYLKSSMPSNVKPAVSLLIAQLYYKCMYIKVCIRTEQKHWEQK